MGKTFATLNAFIKKAAGLADPNRHGFVVPGSLTGTFQFDQERIFGEVVDEAEANRGRLSVEVRRAGRVILSADAERIDASPQIPFPDADTLSYSRQRM